MTRFVTTESGVGRLAKGEVVELLDVPFADIGAALRAGMSAEELAAAPTRREHRDASTTLLAPVLRPGKVWILGWAYRAHRDETGKAGLSEHLPCFLKAPSAVTGPFGDIRLPRVAQEKVDYEGEIALVIGRSASDVEPDEAWAHVFGVTAANDVSARDVQKGALTGGRIDPSLAKSFDTFLPMGPCVTTPDELQDRDRIGLRTYVDGELRQDASTEDLLNPVSTVVSYLSSFTTLEPGDVILTGTPGGVGQVTESFLRAGSIVRVEVEGVGAIENRVVPPPGITAPRVPSQTFVS